MSSETDASRPTAADQAQPSLIALNAGEAGALCVDLFGDDLEALSRG